LQQRRKKSKIMDGLKDLKIKLNLID